MKVQATIIDEFETALAKGSAEHRAEIVREVVNLFVDGAASYSDEQLNLFDDILTRLANDIETAVRAELSRRLVGVTAAPKPIIRRLVLDDMADVAAPLLTHFEPLDEPLLVDCARSKSQGHLLAISQRRVVSEAVTDVLIERGEEPILRSVVSNSGSRFSKHGYTALVSRAESNDILVLGIGARSDLPRHLFLRLLATASMTVREKLEAIDPQNVADIRRVVSQVTGTVAARTVSVSTDYSDALSEVRTLNAAGKLDDDAIHQLGVDRRFELTVAALSILADYDVTLVDHAMVEERSETMLLICKAINLKWTTVRVLLQLRAETKGTSVAQFERELAYFERIKRDTARQILSFHRQRTKTEHRKFDDHRQ
jgi:uncharacterized protein (DUF2336 family)